jgi:hypothetical protein
MSLRVRCGTNRDTRAIVAIRTWTFAYRAGASTPVAEMNRLSVPADRAGLAGIHDWVGTTRWYRYEFGLPVPAGAGNIKPLIDLRGGILDHLARYCAHQPGWGRNFWEFAMRPKSRKDSGFPTWGKLQRALQRSRYRSELTNTLRVPPAVPGRQQKFDSSGSPGLKSLSTNADSSIIVICRIFEARRSASGRGCILGRLRSGPFEGPAIEKPPLCRRMITLLVREQRRADHDSDERVEPCSNPTHT